MRWFCFHAWDYNDAGTERVCHKCGRIEYAHMIRQAPRGWDAYNHANVEWRDYPPTGGNRG